MRVLLIIAYWTASIALLLVMFGIARALGGGALASTAVGVTGCWLLWTGHRRFFQRLPLSGPQWKPMPTTPVFPPLAGGLRLPDQERPAPSMPLTEAPSRAERTSAPSGDQPARAGEAAHGLPIAKERASSDEGIGASSAQTADDNRSATSAPPSAEVSSRAPTSRWQDNVRINPMLLSPILWIGICVGAFAAGIATYALVQRRAEPVAASTFADCVLSHVTRAQTGQIGGMLYQACREKFPAPEPQPPATASWTAAPPAQAAPAAPRASMGSAPDVFFDDLIPMAPPTSAPRAVGQPAQVESARPRAATPAPSPAPILQGGMLRGSGGVLSPPPSSVRSSAPADQWAGFEPVGPDDWVIPEETTAPAAPRSPGTATPSGSVQGAPPAAGSRRR